MSYFVDTHCHLNFNLFQTDLPQVLERARDNSVCKMVVPGTDLTSSRSAVDMCGRYPNLYAAVGIHPNDADEWDENTIPELRDLAFSPFVRAIGEIGLDYYREVTDHTRQKMIFTEQLKLAGELHLPVVIHNRSSIDDLWPILREWAFNLPLDDREIRPMLGVLHSFDGTEALAREAYETGFFLGIGGPVTYKNALDRQELVRQIPLEAMVLETDAPFLTPHPHRGKRNEPSFVPLIAREIARIKNIDPVEVQLRSTKNAMQLFSLGYLD